MTRYQRPRLTINEKLAFLDEYERVPRGQRTLFCRERGVALSAAQTWQKKRREGLLASTDKKESRIALTRSERVDYEQQRQKIADLEARLEQSENAVEILGKASALLESLTKGAAAKQSRPAPIEDPDSDQSGPDWGQRFNRS